MKLNIIPNTYWNSLIYKKIIYHDPCELGRGSGIYEQPRQLLSKYTDIVEISEQKVNSLCCGGSLSNIKIKPNEKKQITDKVLEYYNSYQVEALITSCPLCKKTFFSSNKIAVMDISEIVAQSLKKVQ